MPIVISQNTGSVQYIEHEETLTEILEHTDFDGEDWSVGDRVVFENGTESRIVRSSLSYATDAAHPADFDDVKRAVQLQQARNWSDLFASFR